MKRTIYVILAGLAAVMWIFLLYWSGYIADGYDISGRTLFFNLLWPASICAVLALIVTASNKLYSIKPLRIAVCIAIVLLIAGGICLGSDFYLNYGLLDDNMPY